MGISRHPCAVTLPPERTDCATILDYLIVRFPRVAKEIWLNRMAQGKVHRDDNSPVGPQDPYSPNLRVRYYREVEQEPVIPFQEKILFCNDQILVACKPHFLPVTPGGIYVQECLLNRLINTTGIKTLAPMHRIDRETAGVVLFSTNPETRCNYHDLFSTPGRISKSYLAVGQLPASDDIHTVQSGQSWCVENRIVVGEPWFRMKAAEGEVNARSNIHCLETRQDQGLFRLEPVTGKTHQLRVHMSGLGMPLVNDRLYPELQPKSPDNFHKPLQLLAQRLEFTDPVTGVHRVFESERQLQFGFGDNA